MGYFWLEKLVIILIIYLNKYINIFLTISSEKPTIFQLKTDKNSIFTYIILNIQY